LQTPKHLLLHCKHYTKERKKIKAKGSAALVAFLEKTKIAIASWLLAAEAL
jgi:hypothetical protein